MVPARNHLTIQEKNQVRAYHRERPDLTQEQLREWVHGKFSKWIGRSTIGKIASMPEEICANPCAKRVQSGRYPEMEAELYEYILAKQNEETSKEPGHDDQPILSEGLLWTKANEILIRTRGSNQSVSLGWVQRFKKRHGLHRSQRLVEMQMETIHTVEEQIQSSPAVLTDSTIVTDTTVLESNCVGMKRSRHGETTDDKVATKSLNDTTSIGTTSRTSNRKQFASADDILLLTQVNFTKPWTYPHVMDGWQEVCDQLREQKDFNLEKTAGACQARVALLMDHLRAGNVAALRKSGTSEEYERKRELLVELQANQTAFDRDQGDMCNSKGKLSSPLFVTQHAAAVVKVGKAAAAAAVTETSGETNRGDQCRLELLEIKMEHELAEQRRHADEQVRRLERLQRVQIEAQQKQHAQLLATIQQQQAMMLDLIKSVAAQSNKN